MTLNGTFTLNFAFAQVRTSRFCVVFKIIPECVQKNKNGRSILTAAKIFSMTLVYGDIRLMRIFAGALHFL